MHIGNIFASFAVFFLLSDLCNAIPPPSPYDILRTKTGNVIRCSPDGKAKDSVLPGDAVKMLKKGSVLKFLPGSYSGTFQISVDDVIIEGEPGKLCDATLQIRGKNILIRNLWTSNVFCNTDIRIIDSVIENYTCESSDKKFDQEFYNCCFSTLNVYGYKDNRLTFKNCSIVSDCFPQAICFTSGKKTVSFTNCLLYGKNSVFGFPNNEDIRLSIENAILFGEMGMADGIVKGGGVNKSGKDMKATDIKGLKRLSNQVMIKGELITERPIFKKVLNAGDVDVQPGGRFALDDKSPGKDKNFGANLDKTGFPAPEQTKDKMKPDTPQPAPPPSPKPEPAPEKTAEEKPPTEKEAGDINLNAPESAPTNPAADAK